MGNRSSSYVRLLATLSALVLTATLAGAQAPAQRSPFAGHTYRPGIDVMDYDLFVDVPDTGRTLRGAATLTVRHEPSTTALTLDLVRLGVDSVVVDNSRVEFSRSDTTLTVPLSIKSEVKVSVWYGGVVADGLIIGSDSAGRWTAFGDNWPNRGRYWIPSVDHPSDKATVRWCVRYHPGRTMVANGGFESERRGGGFHTECYREHAPIPVYLMVIALAPLTPTSLGETACGHAARARCVPQVVYTAPEQRASAQAFAHAGGIVTFFSQLVAPFPYEKLAHVQSSTRFGGMENASAIFYADSPFRGRGVNESTIAHETAHQWFGDAVTEREWPHLWLSEGFATYFAALWTEHANGETGFRNAMSGIRHTVLADTVSATRRPVIDSLETNLFSLLNVNSYQKGGFVLHMLRRLVGDSAFFRGIRSYYAAHVNGNALTDDLQSAMEQSSGRPLGWFFDQWLRRPGYAELSTSWRREPTGAIRLTIDQSERFGAYQFPLDVAITDSSGTVKRMTVDVPATKHIEIELPGRYAGVQRLVLDPDVWLLGAIEAKQQ